MWEQGTRAHVDLTPINNEDDMFYHIHIQNNIKGEVDGELKIMS